MTRSVQLVRLLTSVVVGFAACYFAVLYDATSTARFPFDHPDADGYFTESGKFVLSGPTPAVEFITTHDRYAYAVPLAGLVAGIVILWRWPDLRALSELIASTLWVLSFLWIGTVVIVWQLQNIPVFHGMRWHY